MFPIHTLGNMGTWEHPQPPKNLRKGPILNNLRNLRKAAGLSQTELGRRAGITAAAVSYLENGIISPRYSTILRLSIALGCDPEDFIGSDRACAAASKGAADAA
jgi:transcriptional regulator with XRE-family HTH domain